MSGHGQGALTTFIRMQGCNLRCDYCDSKFTWGTKNGDDWVNYIPKEIMAKVEEYGNENVTITGGEPLMQMGGFKSLVNRLWDNDYNISVETNGTIPIPDDVINKVRSWVMDCKFIPTLSLKQKDIRNKNFVKSLTNTDYIKCVVKNRQEFDVAMEIKKYVVEEGNIYNNRPKFCISAMYGKVTPKRLIEWMLELTSREKHNLYLNTQLHKYIWKSTERRR